MPNWYKKSQNWFKKRTPQQERVRYTFSIDGDIFVENQDNEEAERHNAEEKLIGKLPMQADGLRVNNYSVEPYISVI